MLRALLVGNGAREHVIAETLRKRRDLSLVTYASSTNPGIFSLSDGYELGSLTDLPHLREYALRTKPSFAIVGPENPIAAGVSDMLLEIGVHAVAPLQTVSHLEASKGFTRQLLERYAIPGNPRFKIFTSTTGMRSFLESLAGHYVVKADGLMAGKGVKVAGDHLETIDDAIAFAAECIQLHNRVVIEEKLYGVEFSLMSFVDGKTVVDMPPVQDHKRAFEGDKGPNTGGMGSYSDANHLLPFLTKHHLREAHLITQRVCDALFRETGVLYKGVMYGGFMVTRDGVRLIEYNARFGDPEAMNVLPLLETDFATVCQAIIEGKLHELSVVFSSKATVCKYVVPEGYPDHPKKGVKIEVGAVPAGAHLYYASVNERDDGLYLGGSRAVACVGVADTLPQAERIAEEATAAISGPVFHRKDIGREELIRQRIDVVRSFA